MAPEIVEGRRALIVGGGYIGLEAAAVCRKKGLDVTLIEMADRILRASPVPRPPPGSARCTRPWGRDLEGVGLTCSRRRWPCRRRDPVGHDRASL
jgi:3-phenylpropionate/trans-cinnamate dioxygenase ferredoxin reductase subunit